MLFRRKRKERATAPWPAQGVAFRFGQWLASIGGYMAGWSRLTRASIVLVGMALAIPLFWTGHAGWAVVIGGLALAVFWLSVNPTGVDQARGEGLEVLPPSNDEN